MRQLRNSLLGPSGPLSVFHDYPVLLRLASISVCAEIAWGTLIVVLQYHFKDTLLVGQPSQLIAGRIATATLAFVGCETLFKVPFGGLSDRLGPRPVILFALGVAAVSPLLMTLVSSKWDPVDPASQWILFIPLRALDGLGAAALWPSMSALMARNVPRQAKAAAMSVFNGAYCLGLAIGPITGLYLGHHFGNKTVFPLCSLLLICGWFIARSVLSSGIGDKAVGKAASVAGIGSGYGELEEGHISPAALLRGRPMLAKMMILYALSQVAVGLLANVMVVYVGSQFKLQEKDLPALIAGPALIVAFVALPLGRMADSIGRPKAVWISYVMASTGMLLVALTSEFPRQHHPYLSPALLMFGGGLMLLIGSYILGTPAWLGLTSLQVDDTRQGQALSLMQTAQGLGVVIGAGLVALGAPLLIGLTSVRHVISRHVHLPHGIHLPHHVIRHAPRVLIREDVVPADTVSVGVWLWAATAVFFVCLIGTILIVREPEHIEHSEPPVQPLDLTGA